MNNEKIQPLHLLAARSYHPSERNLDMYKRQFDRKIKEASRSESCPTVMILERHGEDIFLRKPARFTPAKWRVAWVEPPPTGNRSLRVRICTIDVTVNDWEDFFSTYPRKSYEEIKEEFEYKAVRSGLSLEENWVPECLIKHHCFNTIRLVPVPLPAPYETFNIYRRTRKNEYILSQLDAMDGGHRLSAYFHNNGFETLPRSDRSRFLLRALPERSPTPVSLTDEQLYDLTGKHHGDSD